MKKILSVIFLLLVPVLFVGCGKTDKQKTTESEQVIEDTASSKETESSPQLSDDLYSFEICLNGKSYKLPAAYSEFEKNGWSIESKDTDVIAPNQYTLSQVMKNGENIVYVGLVNTGSNELPFKECKVGSIDLDSFNAKKGATLSLPKGIGFDSTKDDVTKAYGDPTNTSELDTETHLTYEIGTYQIIEIYIDKKSNKVSHIKVKNLVETADTSPSNDSSTNSEVPESVTNYKAPSELTDDILSFNAKYDGVLYHMPAPVAEFEKNGWALQDAPKDDIAARDSVSGVVLRKGNQTFRTYIYNNSSKATNAKNCFVTEITADDYRSKIPLELPKGIKVGSTKADMEAAYAGINVEKGDSASLEFYTYKKKVLQQIDITVNKDTGIVSTIKIHYQPGKSDK